MHAARAHKLPLGHGAAPTPEEMDGLDSDDEPCFGQNFDDEEAEEDGQDRAHGIADVLKCSYEDLHGIEKPTEAQMAVGGECERTAAEVEADAQRLEEQLLTVTPPSQDF